MKPKRRPAKSKEVKHTVKFLQHPLNPAAARQVIRSAPEGVIKKICDIALNAKSNPAVKLTPAQRKTLAQHRRQIGVLTDLHKSVKKKRQLLQSGGVLPFLPVLLGSAIATLGAHLFSK